MNFLILLQDTEVNDNVWKKEGFGYKPFLLKSLLKETPNRTVEENTWSQTKIRVRGVCGWVESNNLINSYLSCFAWEYQRRSKVRNLVVDEIHGVFLAC